MEGKKKEIVEFYEKIVSAPKLKEKIVENAKRITNEEDLKKLIREEIMPIMKKFNVNFSENELLNYEKEALKVLAEDDLKNVSGGSISVKSLMAPGLMAFMLMGFSAAAPQSEAMFNEVDNRPQVSWFTRFTQYIRSFFQERIHKELFNNLASYLPRRVNVNKCVSDGKNLYEFKKIEGSEEVSIALIAKNDQTEWEIPEKVYDIYGNLIIVGAVHKDTYGSMQSLKKITANPNLKKIRIGKRCFLGSKNLKIFDVSGVKEASIGEFAFSNCSNLTSVILPSNAEKLNVDVAAFTKCIALKEIICSGKIINIDAFAFIDCQNLISIYLVGNTINIKPAAFCYCKNLEKLSLICESLIIGEAALFESYNKNPAILYCANKVTLTKFDGQTKTYNFYEKTSGDSYINFNDTEGAERSSYNGNYTGNANLQRLLFSRPQNTNNDSGPGNSTEDTRWEGSSVPKTADINAVAGRKKVKPVPKYENPFSVLSDDEDYE